MTVSSLFADTNTSPIDMTFSSIDLETSPYQDWAGFPGSPASFEQASMSFDSETVLSFDQDIDNVFTSDLCFDQVVDINPINAGDWEAVKDAAQPSSPSLTDDVSSCWLSIADQPPLSPISEWTLVDSPPVPENKLSLEDGQQADHLLPSSFDSTFGDGFFFDFDLPFTTLDTMPEHGLVDTLNCSDYGPGYPLAQHMVGAAGAGAPGLVTGLNMNVGDPAFNFEVPTLPYPPSLSSPVDNTGVDESAFLAIEETTYLAIEEKKEIATRKKPLAKIRNKRRCDDDSDYLSGDSNNSSSTTTKGEIPSPKKRKQDTTKRFPCPHEGCDKKFARTNNLKQHIDGVHRGLRPFPCTEGCEQTFKREHDLARHIQSAHTDLGSPRTKNKGGKKDSAAKKGRAVKKGTQAQPIVKEDE